MHQPRTLAVASVLLWVSVAWGCSGSGDESTPDQPAAAQPAATQVATSDLQVSSPNFTEVRPRKRIPEKNTCYGENWSPPLSWTGAPEGTQSLALIAEDLDHDTGIWVHWVLYNIPADVAELQEGIPTSTLVLPDGTTQGTNDNKATGYNGPCPPTEVKSYAAYLSGADRKGGAMAPKLARRYVFTLYALDRVLDLGPAATKTELLSAIEGHVLAKGQTMGKHQAPIEQKKGI